MCSHRVSLQDGKEETAVFTFLFLHIHLLENYVVLIALWTLKMVSRSLLFLIAAWILPITFITCKPIDLIFDQSDNDPSMAGAVLFDLSCDPCSPGWGVKTLCNGTFNTVCIPCPSGTWSPKRPHFRPCLPCSKCGDGLYEDIPCTNTRDTKCDSCANVKGHFNDDYKKKCDWLLAPESLKSASEEIDPEEYDSDDDIDIDWGNDIQYGHDENDDDQDTEEEAVPIFDKMAIRKRIMSLGTLAADELEGLTEKLQKKPDMELDAGVDEDQANPVIPHIIRPLPRMTPRRDPLVEPVPVDVLDSWEEDVVEPEERRIEVNFPPSYHSYPIESLMHKQQRKTLIVMVLTSVMVIMAVAVLILYAVTYRRRHRSMYHRTGGQDLSPEEREIVRNSANRLEQMERPVKRFQFVNPGYKPLVNAPSDLCLSITENPLESYLRDDSKPAFLTELSKDGK